MFISTILQSGSSSLVVLFERFIDVEESRVKFCGVDPKLRKEAYGRNFTIL